MFASLGGRDLLFASVGGRDLQAHVELRPSERVVPAQVLAKHELLDGDCVYASSVPLSIFLARVPGLCATSAAGRCFCGNVRKQPSTTDMCDNPGSLPSFRASSTFLTCGSAAQRLDLRSASPLLRGLAMSPSLGGLKG